MKEGFAHVHNPQLLIMQPRKNTVHRAWRREAVRTPVVRSPNTDHIRFQMPPLSDTGILHRSFATESLPLTWNRRQCTQSLVKNLSLEFFWSAVLSSKNLQLLPPNSLQLLQTSRTQAQAPKQPQRHQPAQLLHQTSPPTAPSDMAASQRGDLVPKRRFQYLKGEVLQAKRLLSATGTQAKTAVHQS